MCEQMEINLKNLMLFGDWGVNACFISGACLGHFEAFFIECLRDLWEQQAGDLPVNHGWMHNVWDDEIAVAPVNKREGKKGLTSTKSNIFF